jgi:hypothetical protein
VIVAVDYLHPPFCLVDMGREKKSVGVIDVAFLRGKTFLVKMEEGR